MSERARNHIALDGRGAVVTGGAQGLGLAIAQRLVASGAKVAIWDADQAAIDVAIATNDLHAEHVDLTDVAAVLAAAVATSTAIGPIDILINNAGIAGSTGPTHEYDVAEWRTIVDINLTASFFCIKALVPGMIERGYGRIVNVASIAGKEGNPAAAAYAASKAGLIALTKSLGKELATLDIAVNAITPAAARTRILDQVGAEFVRYMLSRIPRGRFLELDEAAAMVAWLASEENSFTTGAVFDLSGGRATY